MCIFGHSEFIPVSVGKVLQKNSEWPLFVPVFLGKIVGKKSEWPFLVILSLYQSSWEKLLEKNLEWHFLPFRICTSLLGKNCWKKIRMAIFGHSEFISVFLGKIVGKNMEWSF